MSISAQSRNSSSVSTGHTTSKCSWADIVKNIDKAPLSKSTVELENEINGIIHKDFNSATLHKEPMADKHETHDVPPNTPELISPTIVYLDDDSDTYTLKVFLSVNSENFESEPDNKSNFTRVLCKISKNEKIKNRKCEGNQDKTKRSHETAFSSKQMLNPSTTSRTTKL